MWVKIRANNVDVIRTVLPSSEQLPDGSWVTGFPGADPATIELAGWHQAVEPLPAPDNGFEQTLTWSWDGVTAMSAWVQGAAIPPPLPTTDEKLESFKVGVEGSTTLTDVKEAVALWL